MCTSVSMNNSSFCFGRNMDIEFTLESSVVLTPRAYPLRFRMAGELDEHYAYIGAAVLSDGTPLYCDAMNEKGLCAAALSFPECVYLRTHAENKAEIAPFELISWVLSQCADIPQVMSLLSNTVLCDIPFSEAMPNTPLHWHFADRSSALVLECTAEGMKLHHDPVGVLTNSPPFEHHLMNLRQYGHLTTGYPACAEQFLSPFGRGFGAVGLPGDMSPMSRYVRAAFLKLNSPPLSGEKLITQHFHVLECVSMPRGSVYTEDGREEITAYSSCMCGSSYYFRTYNDSRIRAVDMAKEALSSAALVCYPMEDEGHFIHLS